jgi:hypothetical protein
MYHIVIPGRPAGPSPESIIAVGANPARTVAMDSGQPLRGFRNDGGGEKA